MELKRSRTDNFRAKKRLGQHFLVDQQVLRMIIETAQLTPSARVLEIGPGLGVLTGALSDATPTGLVLAVEKDHDLVEQLRARFKNRKNVKILADDILFIPLAALLQPPYQVVANLPYSITSPVITKFLLGDYRHKAGENSPRPESLTLLVQKEVAERLTAEPGEHARGILTVLIELFGHAELIAIVPPIAFEPRPQVESAIIRIELHEPAVEPTSFHWLLKIGFVNRRRQFHNSLAGSLGINSESAKQLLKEAKINPLLRAEQLTLKQWLQLYQAVRKLKL